MFENWQQVRNTEKKTFWTSDSLLKWAVPLLVIPAFFFPPPFLLFKNMKTVHCVIPGSYEVGQVVVSHLRSTGQNVFRSGLNEQTVV